MDKKIVEATTGMLAECIQMSTGLPVRKARAGVEMQINGYWSRCQLDFDDFCKTEDGVMSVARVQLTLSQEVNIQDVIVGVGATTTDSAISAVQQFVSCFVAPMAALSPQYRADHCGHEDSVILEEIDFAGANWTISSCEVMSNDADGRLHEALTHDVPLNRAWPVLQQKLHDRHPHWVKVYLIRYPDGVTDGEIRIDNQIDEQLTERLLTFVWPTEQEFIWFRQFGYVEPVGYNHLLIPGRTFNPVRWFSR